MPGNYDLLVLGDLAGEDAANRQAPNIFVVIDIRHQQLQRIVSQSMRRRNRFDDLIEKRAQAS